MTPSKKMFLKVLSCICVFVFELKKSQPDTAPLIGVLGTQYQFLQWLGFIFCPQNFGKKFTTTSFGCHAFLLDKFWYYIPQVLGTITVTTQKYAYLPQA
jgi:hypothetical protein